MNGKAVDVWSLGITLYCLVHGRCPFEEQDILLLSEKVLHDKVEFGNISTSLKNLISRMLEKDPSKRITVPEMKVHSWVTRNGQRSMMSTDKNCIYDEITEEELRNAFSPAVKFVTRIMDKLIRRKSTKHPENVIHNSKDSSISRHFEV